MATDFNNLVSNTLTSENKLTLSTGRVARFSYDEQALTQDHVAGTASYDYNQDNNIPLTDNLMMSPTILSKGLRSQASSFTRMAVNHFFGRCSFNINKLSEHLKNLLIYFKDFLKESNNAWTATTEYDVGDIVYFMSTLDNRPCKRTFICTTACLNLAPMDSSGHLINNSYWTELTGNLPDTTTQNATVNGVLTVNGDIIQSGSSYETHAEKLYTKKDMIITREDAVSGLQTSELTGITAQNYSGQNINGVLGFDNTGTARVGDVGNEQPLLTRDEATNLVSGAPFIWDSVNKRAVSGAFAGLNYTEIIEDTTLTLSSNTYVNITSNTINPVTLVINDSSRNCIQLTVRNSTTIDQNVQIKDVTGTVQTFSIASKSFFSVIWLTNGWISTNAPAVGATFVQYPNQKPPATVYPCSKWEILDYDGAFFRAQGTNADAFIEETNSLVKQSQATAENGLTFRGTSATISVSGANHNHTGSVGKTNLAHTHNYNLGATGGSGGDYPKGYYSTNDSWAKTTGGANTNLNHSHTIPDSGDLSMSGTFTPSGSIVGDIETRPVNYTVRIWKRTA